MLQKAANDMASIMTLPYLTSEENCHMPYAIPLQLDDEPGMVNSPLHLKYFLWNCIIEFIRFYMMTTNLMQACPKTAVSQVYYEMTIFA